MNIGKYSFFILWLIVVTVQALVFGLCDLSPRVIEMFGNRFGLWLTAASIFTVCFFMINNMACAAYSRAERDKKTGREQHPVRYRKHHH